jgi:hypothetical protein
MIRRRAPGLIVAQYEISSMVRWQPLQVFVAGSISHSLMHGDSMGSGLKT